MMADTIEHSVIIPVHNEVGVIETLLDDVCEVMGALVKPFEILVIDDGSTDETWGVLKAAAQAHPEIVAHRLNRNFGQQAAICAGLVLARGRGIGIMDGDGQDPPDVLKQLFERWQGGCDVAYAVRRNRQEGALKRTCYRAFYRVLSAMAEVPVPLDAGDFSVIDRDVARFITTINDRTPFVRGLRSWYGGRQAAVEYDRRERQGGKTKYSWLKLIDLAINGITSLSKLPLRGAIYAGGMISLLSFCYATFVVLRRIFIGFPQDWAWSVVVTLVAFLGGLNLLLVGFVGEYIAHIFDASKQFPLYLIRESTAAKTPSHERQSP